MKIELKLPVDENGNVINEKTIVLVKFKKVAKHRKTGKILNETNIFSYYKVHYDIIKGIELTCIKSIDSKLYPKLDSKNLVIGKNNELKLNFHTYYSKRGIIEYSFICEKILL